MENNEKKTTFCVCSKCSQPKYARKAVYEARVKKFGSVEALTAGYLCRDCRRTAK